MLTVDTIVRIGDRGVLLTVELLGHSHLRVLDSNEELNPAEKNTAAKELEVEFGRIIVSGN